MKRVASFFLALAMAAPALATPDGKPARVPMLGRWRIQDPVRPRAGAEPWTPADVAGFLALHPEAKMDLGVFDAYPVGNTHWLRLGDYVRETRAVSTANGIEAGRRMCLTERPDVVQKFASDIRSCSPETGGGGCDWEGSMDGRLGEQETVVKVASRASGGGEASLTDDAARWSPGAWQHRLLVLRPGLPGEERRRVVASGDGTIEVAEPWTAPPKPGDPFEIRGSFDPAWIRSVSGATHAATVRRFWVDRRDVCGLRQRCDHPAEPLDPFEGANRRSWPPHIDRPAYEALRTGGRVPALYGSVADQGEAPYWEDPFFRVSALVADVGNQDYRNWRLRYLLYKLQDHGFEPGDPVCITIAYKPGWHTHHGPDQGTNLDPCNVPDARQWTGPAHVCGVGKVDGLFHPTTYGPREFETGINAYFRELFATLEANGYGNAEILTTEGPTYTRRLWTILADDVRRNPKLIGERGGWMRPPLAALTRAGLRNLSATPPALGGRPSAPNQEPKPNAPASPPASAPPGQSPPAAPPPTANAPRQPPPGDGSWSVRSTPKAQPRAGVMRSGGSTGNDGIVEAPSRR